MLDAGLNAKRLNNDLTISHNESGSRIEPKHVQKLLRHWLGIANHPLSIKYDLQADELDLQSILN